MAIERARAAQSRLGHSHATEALDAVEQFAYALTGDMRRVDPDAPALDRLHHVARVVGARHFATAATLYEAGQLEAARERVADARRALDETDLWWIGAQVDAVLAAHAGDSGRARVVVEETRRSLGAGRRVVAPDFLRSMDMCTWLLLGRPAQVLRLYEGAGIRITRTSG